MILWHLRMFLVTLLAVASICMNKTATVFSNNVTDQQALLAIKASIPGDPLGVLSSWNHSVHFCHWEGITCKRQRVTELNLTSRQLEGTLSPHIGNLTLLSLLYLDTNSFHGSIPSQIGRLFHMQNLSLSYNSFHGGFPANLTSCINIRSIVLFNNKLGGKLPTNFASWPKLREFAISDNQFTGPIPPSIVNLSSLGFLNLARNNLWGMVPLPLYNISSIYSLNINENQLEGSLPPDFGYTLPNLQYFYAALNKLSGPFPPSIANASGLLVFEIGRNNITGPLISFGRLSYLQALSLSFNQLGHNQPFGDLSFLNSLVNCTRLDNLNLYGNDFSGELPNSIVNFSIINKLDLGSNYIYGSIPQEIGKLVNLVALGFDYNNLTGSIPQSIGQLSKLGKLYLHGNNFSGGIPSSISNITGLLVLVLFSNMLQGSIPAAIFNISSLEEFYLNNNYLSGVIPEQIIGLSSNCHTLYLNNNLFTGRLPSNIGSLKQLVALDVSQNNLTGELPSTLGDCVMLRELWMNGNLFQGNIPASFKRLRSLEVLDLSNNLLSGNIPNFLGEFSTLNNLNLSHNKLEGEVPKEGVFSNLSAFSVIGNLQLCGGVEALHYHACPMTKKKQFSSRVIPLLVLLPLAVLLACFALIFYCLRKPKQKRIPVTVKQNDQQPGLSYQDLLVATADFSPKNLLGEGRYGSVYKGVVESLQQVVAVKVLNVEVRGATKSFLSECETLRNIRHRNLIKIITACSSTDFKGNDFKALVFEFMMSGSLDNWLHPSQIDEGNERNLTLLQRLNVAIDVALGLNYLHHHSHTKIIHCDIKPSNILLDEEFVARIADFGLAKFFLPSTGDINRPHTSSTGIRGTVGYVPPEYGMGGEISAEGDVYSYGILLLELFSGKRPTDSRIFANTLHEYVRKALPDRVMQVADPRITLLDHNSTIANKTHSRAITIQVCLARIFEVGILCSAETPRERIDIRVALKQLHVARDLLVSPNQ